MHIVVDEDGREQALGRGPKLVQAHLLVEDDNDRRVAPDGVGEPDDEDADGMLLVDDERVGVMAAAGSGVDWPKDLVSKLPLPGRSPKVLDWMERTAIVWMSQNA